MIRRLPLDQIDPQIVSMVETFDKSQANELKLSMIQNFVDILKEEKIPYSFEKESKIIYLKLEGNLSNEVVTKMLPIGPILKLKGRFPVLAKW